MTSNAFMRCCTALHTFFQTQLMFAQLTQSSIQSSELLLCLVWVCKTTEEGKKSMIHWLCWRSRQEKEAERLTVWFFKQACFKEMHCNTVRVSFRYADDSGSSLRYIEMRWCGGDEAPTGEILHMCKYFHLSWVGTVWIIFYVCPILELISFQEKFLVVGQPFSPVFFLFVFDQMQWYNCT